MKIIYIFKSIVVLMALTVLGACSGSSSSGSSASKVNLNVSFKQPGSSATASKAAVSNIANILIEVIPGSTSSVTPSPTNITPVNGVIPPTASILALTDNETYLFRITATDSGGNIIYTGQTVQQLFAGNNTVNLNCYSMNGFGTAAATYSITTSSGTNQVFTVNASGTSTWNSGQNLIFLSATADPSVFKTDVILRDVSGVYIASETGTISTAQATTVNTSYTVSRFTGNLSEQYTIASGYRGMVINTDGGADEVYGLQSITSNVAYALQDLNNPVPLGSNSATNILPRSMASNGNSQYLVTWPETSGTNYIIMGRFCTRDANGTFITSGSAFVIDTSTNPGDDSPLVAFDGTNFLVVWSRDMGGSFNIYGRFVNPSTGPTGSAITFSVGPPGDTSDLALAYFSGTSRYYLTNSFSPDGINYNYYISTCDTSGNITGGPVQINSTSSLASNPTSIAFDGTNLLVTMPIFTIDDTIGHIYARLFTTADIPVAVSAEFPVINTGNRKFGGFPSFYSHPTTAANSYYLVTYTDFGTTSSTFYGQKINTSGALVGSPFVIANNAAFGSCNYSSFEGSFRCIYNGYSSYVQSVSSMIGNLNIVYGRAILP